MVTKLFDRLPDATWVYPGHGSDTTIGAERPHLEEWRERGWQASSPVLQVARLGPLPPGAATCGRGLHRMSITE